MNQNQDTQNFKKHFIINVNNYFSYVTNVLGLRGITSVHASMESGSIAVAKGVRDTLSTISWELGYDKTKTYDFIFLLEGKNWAALQPENKELFLKMRAALKLNKKLMTPGVVAPQWDDETLKKFIGSTDSLTEYILLTNDQELLNQVNKIKLNIADKNILIIPSLELMQKNIYWKRFAWERLKTITAND